MLCVRIRIDFPNKSLNHFFNLPNLPHWQFSSVQSKVSRMSRNINEKSQFFLFRLY